MIWRTSPLFPAYEVSEFGHVRRNGRVVKSFPRADGYQAYTLRRDGKTLHAKAHQLVADAFICPKPFEGAEVCHNDGTRTNDHYSNLRWDTRSANHLDKRRHGTSLLGERSPSAKLTANRVGDLKFLRTEGYTQRELGFIFGLTQGSISRILNGKRWAYQ